VSQERLLGAYSWDPRCRYVWWLLFSTWRKLIFFYLLSCLISRCVWLSCCRCRIVHSFRFKRWSCTCWVLLSSRCAMLFHLFFFNDIGHDWLHFVTTKLFGRRGLEHPVTFIILVIVRSSWSFLIRIPRECLLLRFVVLLKLQTWWLIQLLCNFLTCF